MQNRLSRSPARPLRAVSALALPLVLGACGSGPRLPSEDLFLAPERAARRFAEPVITPEERRAEVEEKVRRVRAFLSKRKLDGLLLTQENHFGWMTGGGEDFVVHAQREGQAKVLVTPREVVLLSNNIEAPRLQAEVVAGLGFLVEEFPFYESAVEEPKRVAKYSSKIERIATDASRPGAMVSLFPEDLFELFYPLTPSELKKYQWLGRKCSEVIETVADQIRPGMTEFDIQHLIAREMWYWDIFPTVNLASVDGRVRKFKHPFPEGARLEKYVNLNVCVRRWGLIISMSRLMHFGEPDEELKKAFETGGRVMAAMLHASRVGSTFREVLEANEEAYRAGGYEGEWLKHLQGGPILSRERIALLREVPDAVITDGMVLAYNPTCAGSKHEDTFIVRKERPLELLTPCRRWPTRGYEVEGEVYHVPDLKVVRED